MELNAEQIKKALECCVTTSAGDCNKCGYKGKKRNIFITCTNCLISDALALINSQEQRIKELEKYNADMKVCGFSAKDLAGKCEELAEENERLHASCTELTQCCTKHETLYKIECKRVDTVKADTVRKMHSEIKERCIKGGIYPAFVASTIDQIAKEMLEGEK